MVLISKAHSMLFLKDAKTKKNIEQTRQNPKVFAAKNENIFKQEPIKVDELNSNKERITNEQSAKRKKGRPKMTEKNSA